MKNKGRQAAGYTIQKRVHYCSTCDSYGHGQGMVGHIKNCDGSGLKNYWSRIKSNLLKAQAVGMISLKDVDMHMTALKNQS